MQGGGARDGAREGTPRRRASRTTDDEGEETDEDIVMVRSAKSLGPGEDPGLHEVRISCPDATGLGCDITRMLLDFGCRILDGDISTDGRWCFMIFKVLLGHGVPSYEAHWALLRERLISICPNGEGQGLLRPRSPPVNALKPHLLEISSYDRRGFLHDLMNTLWEADVVVFKAHVTTAPGGEVLDLFWVYDNKCELPEMHRKLQIAEVVRQCLRQREVKCTIEAAPPETCLPEASLVAPRRACKDASSASPLRNVTLGRVRSVCDVKSNCSDDSQIPPDEFAWPEDVSATLDNQTTSAYSVVNVSCRDRKGLVYDMMRTLKDIQIRVGYAKIKVVGDRAEADLFVQEDNGKRISDEHLEEELLDRVRESVQLPVRITIKDVFDDTCTELCVTARLDSGGRGRPRVTYDVTRALSDLGGYQPQKGTSAKFRRFAQTKE